MTLIADKPGNTSRWRRRLARGVGWVPAWLIWWITAFSLIHPTSSVYAAENFQYFYDETGQLTKAVDSQGNVVEYVYDEVGNLLEIKRSTVTPGGLAIFDFTPKQGPIGTAVTVQGQGFGATPAANVVQFNGAVATVGTATVTTLTTTVAAGATTGPISVNVAAATATSSQNFTVTNAPVITSIQPRIVFTNATLSNLVVTGANLTGAVFSVSPAFVPPAITVNSASIDPSGATATLNMTTGTRQGRFVLVATTANGGSGSAPTAGNTMSVVDTLSNADTDGDGYPDGLEGALGSDPYDPASKPNPMAFVTQAVSPMVSVLNQVSPLQLFPPASAEVTSSSFSVLNLVSPAQVLPPAVMEAVGPTFSIQNQSP